MTSRFFFAFTLAAASAMLPAQTGQQIDAGRVTYQARCVGCHGTDLGGGEAPQLAGANFRAAWGTRNASELVTFIQAGMPPDRPGSLSVADAAGVSAFILAANGTPRWVLNRSSPFARWRPGVPPLRWGAEALVVRRRRQLLRAW
jgi:mono/diheme cytochrome c family protein